jgi:hypothetical protein
MNRATRFEAVARLAAWDPEGAHKAGMMLWNLNPPSSQETTARWSAAIADHLP